MKVKVNSKYRLAAGAQVREEDFGLLFYQMNGPRLHFVASGDLLSEKLFKGKMTLGEWMCIPDNAVKNKNQEIRAIIRTLGSLIEKGVIIEC